MKDGFDEGLAGKGFGFRLSFGLWVVYVALTRSGLLCGLA